MVRAFIEKLGKPKEVAAAVSAMSGSSLTAKAVGQWGRDGNVPYRWRPYVFALAEKKRVKVPRGLSPFAAKPSEAKTP